MTALRRAIEAALTYKKTVTEAKRDPSSPHDHFVALIDAINNSSNREHAYHMGYVQGSGTKRYKERHERHDRNRSALIDMWSDHYGHLDPDASRNSRGVLDPTHYNTDDPEAMAVDWLGPRPKKITEDASKGVQPGKNADNMQTTDADDNDTDDGIESPSKRNPSAIIEGQVLAFPHKDRPEFNLRMIHHKVMETVHHYEPKTGEHKQLHSKIVKDSVIAVPDGISDHEMFNHLQNDYLPNHSSLDYNPAPVADWKELRQDDKPNEYSLMGVHHTGSWPDEITHRVEHWVKPIWKHTGV